MALSAFKRGVVGTFLSAGYLNGIAFVTSLITARLLGPEGRGELGLLFVYSQMAWWLAGLGLSRGHIYHLSQSTDALLPAKIFTQSILFSIVMGLATTGVMLLVIGAILSGSDSETLSAAMVFIATIPLMMLSDQIMNILLGLREYRLFNVKRILLPTMYSLAIVFLYLLGLLSVSNLVIAQTINVGVELSLSIVLLSRRSKIRWRFDKRLFKDCFSFGIKSYPVDIAETVNQNIDQLVVAPWLGTYNFGIYAVARSMANAITLLPSSIATLLFPEMASRDALGARTLLKKALIVSVPILLGAFVVLYLLIPELVSLFLGAAYAKSAELSKVLLLGFAFLSLSQMMQNGFYGMQRQLEASAINWAGVVINVSLLGALVPSLGLEGAAIAFVVGAFIKSAIFLQRFAHGRPT